MTHRRVPAWGRDMGEAVWLFSSSCIPKALLYFVFAVFLQSKDTSVLLYVLMFKSKETTKLNIWKTKYGNEKGIYGICLWKEIVQDFMASCSLSHPWYTAAFLNILWHSLYFHLSSPALWNTASVLFAFLSSVFWSLWEGFTGISSAISLPLLMLLEQQ